MKTANLLNEGSVSVEIGAYTLSRYDNDYILITAPYRKQCKITGGDFELILSGLCSVEQII